eukprot:COSAG02_NODE_11722_length_1667_cov_1.094388_2_plen_120_part_00
MISDFEKGFIKAEVCAYDDYKALTTKPSDAEVKAAGKYRQEGKTYVMQDGDIVHFQVTHASTLLPSSAPVLAGQATPRPLNGWRLVSRAWASHTCFTYADLRACVCVCVCVCARVQFNA